MKKNKFLYVVLAALAVIIISACTHEEPEVPSNQDEAEYAANASISSEDASFIATSEGGSISFTASGGDVVINVDCGVEWTTDNSATDVFSTVARLGSCTLTVTAGQNMEVRDINGTITFYTAASHIKFATLGITQSAYNTPEITVESNELHVPAVGELAVETEVTCTVGDFEIVNETDWLSAERTETGILVTAQKNDDTEERAANLALVCSDGIRSGRTVIQVTQDGLAYISPSRTGYVFYDNAGSSTVTVESNFDWDYTNESSDGWYTVSREGDALKVTVKANDSGAERESFVTLTASDGAQNTAEATLSVYQYAELPNALILEYTTTRTNIEIQLPLSGTVDCSVDWGDDSEIESVTKVLPTHTYSKAGVYEVRIIGSVSEICSQDISTDVSQYLTDIIQWGDLGLTSMYCAFYRNANLKSIPEDYQNAFSNVTTFAFAFYNCGSLANISERAFLDCSSSESFRSTYYNCTSLKSIPADLFTNATSAILMIYTFYGCTGLEAIPETLFESCTSVTDFYCTFYSCTSLTSIPAGLFSKCVAVEEFLSAFDGCTGLTEVPEGLFDACTKATSFYATFNGCSNIETIPAKLFAKCPDAQDFGFTFYGCSNLKAIPEGLFDNCPTIVIPKCTFYNCSSVEEIPADLFKNNNVIISFYRTFYGMSSLKAIPEGLFDYTPDVTEFDATFYGCSSVTTIPQNLFYKCPNVTRFYRTFFEQKSLTEIPEGLFDYCPKVTDFNGVFYYAEKITSIPEDLFAKCPDVTDFSWAFDSCKSLVEIPKNLFANQSKVTDFGEVFYYCETVKSIPENLFATCPDVESFKWAFAHCKALESIPSGIYSNQKKVTTFDYGFYNCLSATGESPYDVVDGTKIHLYDRTAANGYTAPTSYVSCFGRCEKLDDFNTMPTSWGGGETAPSTTASSQKNIISTESFDANPSAGFMDSPDQTFLQR